MRDDTPTSMGEMGQMDILEDPMLARAVQTLQELPIDDPGKVERILAAAFESRAERMVSQRRIARGAAESSRLWRWGMVGVVAAAIFGFGFTAGHLIRDYRKASREVMQAVARSGRVIQGVITPGARRGVALASSTSVSSGVLSGAGSNAAVPTTFHLRAEHARFVALVGDFNAWNPTSTPLTRSADGASWVGDVMLTPGRHTYAFVVDGTVVPDPTATNVREPDYGVVVSTLVVRGAE